MTRPERILESVRQAESLVNCRVTTRTLNVDGIAVNVPFAVLHPGHLDDLRRLLAEIRNELWVPRKEV